MDYYRSNAKNTKIYNKINYLRLLIAFLTSFILFALLFYFIGNSQNLVSSLTTSLVISLLISLGYIISDLSENRDRVYIIKKNELGYIEMHKEKSGGAFVKEMEYDRALDKYSVEEIYKDNSSYEGIDKGIIKEVVSIKEKSNRLIVEAKVSEKQWVSSSFFFVSNLHLVDKEYVKTLIIPKDYDNYEKLYKTLSKIK